MASEKTEICLKKHHPSINIPSLSLRKSGKKVQKNMLNLA